MFISKIFKPCEALFIYPPYPILTESGFCCGMDYASRFLFTGFFPAQKGQHQLQLDQEEISGDRLIINFFFEYSI